MSPCHILPTPCHILLVLSGALLWGRKLSYPEGVRIVAAEFREGLLTTLGPQSLTAIGNAECTEALIGLLRRLEARMRSLPREQVGTEQASTP